MPSPNNATAVDTAVSVNVWLSKPIPSELPLGATVLVGQDGTSTNRFRAGIFDVFGNELAEVADSDGKLQSFLDKVVETAKADARWELKVDLTQPFKTIGRPSGVPSGDPNPKGISTQGPFTVGSTFTVTGTETNDMPSGGVQQMNNVLYHFSFATPGSSNGRASFLPNFTGSAVYYVLGSGGFTQITASTAPPNLRDVWVLPNPTSPNLSTTAPGNAATITMSCHADAAGSVIVLFSTACDIYFEFAAAATITIS